MRPAFTSPWRAAGFGVLLAVLLALPLLMAKVGWRDRRDAYLSVMSNAGAFPWIEEKLFTETTSVDVAFVGSSRIWAGISAPYFKEKLEERLGRKSEVFTLGWNWSGYDMLYEVVSDLLERRHVRLLVIYNEDPEGPHPFAHCLIRPGEQTENLEGMSLPARASCYASTVLGTPRQLWGMLQGTNLDSHWSANPFYAEPDQDDLRQQLGSLRRRKCPEKSGSKFAPFHPTSKSPPPRLVRYLEGSQEEFEFVGPQLGEYQHQFALKLAGLCRRHGTKVVAIYLPLLAERENTVMSWRKPWDELAKSIDLLGLPNAKLFAGIPADDVQKLFYDGRHLNQNGQDFFTAAVTPALLEMYDSATNNF